MSDLSKKCLDLIPTAIASRAFGLLSDTHFPKKIQHGINKAFATVARLNMDEATQSVDEFETLNQLFTRKVKSDARPIANSALISPVDGKLTAFGHVDDETIFAVKKQEFNVDDLVGTTAMHDWLVGSYYFIIYLSPQNYHRIHAPIRGRVTQMSYVPGRLLPVNRLGLAATNNLFPTNERLTSFIEADNGSRAALCKVGATCVGKITVNYDECITNATLKRAPLYKSINSKIYEPGDELGIFNLGSTVILFVDAKNFKPSPMLTLDMKVQMGQALGNFDQD